MKKIINITPLNTDALLLIARIAIGSMMLIHGLPKLVMLFSGDPVAFPDVLGLTPGFSLALAVFAEVICSVFVLIGLGTRLAVIPLIITMLVAVFIVHSTDPFAKQELGLHYLLVYVMLLIGGSGQYSVDKLLTAKIGN